LGDKFTEKVEDGAEQFASSRRYALAMLMAAFKGCNLASLAYIQWGLGFGAEQNL
jgi:hypothetical protein